MKLFVFLILITGLSISVYSQSKYDPAKIKRVKNWEEYLRFKPYLEMKNQFHIEDSLNNIRKNIHYPYEKKRSLYYFIYIKYFDIIPLSPSLEHDDYWYKG